jgi:tetratricopeptide (TPR) repeat protein
MCGAGQLALPLLTGLNKQFPKNSTILNNIGQAWYSLGDINKAEKYIDSTLLLYANHAQANFTKSLIEESKGNKTAAVEAMKKSIKEAYTEEKRRRLHKLGYKINGMDITWTFKPKPDALGLGKFKHPPIPKTPEECPILAEEWKQFHKVCMANLEKIRIRKNEAYTVANQAEKDRIEKIKSQIKEGWNTGEIVVDEGLIEPFYKSKAEFMFMQLYDEHSGLTIREKKKKVIRESSEARRTMLRSELDNKINELGKVNPPNCGEEGQPGCIDLCPETKRLYDEYLAAYNTDWEIMFDEIANMTRLEINDKLFYQQFMLYPEEFEVAILDAQETWIKQLMAQGFISKAYYCEPQNENEKESNVGPLPDFDVVHCEYHTEIWTPIWSFNIDCSRMTSKVDIGVVKFEMKDDLNKEDWGDQFISCTVEIGVGKGAGYEAGPLKAEASVGAGVAAEFDRTGLKDLIVKASSGVSVGTNTGDVKGATVDGSFYEAGVKGQVSLISGSASIESSGILNELIKFSN